MTDNKQLLYKKLNALRLEVDASIVDDIKKTVDAVFEEVSTEWISEKPEFKEDCILLTAYKTKDGYEYQSWLISKLDSIDGWYWGLCTIEGEEYGDIEELNATFYKIISSPTPPVTK